MPVFSFKYFIVRKYLSPRILGEILSSKQIVKEQPHHSKKHLDCNGLTGISELFRDFKQPVGAKSQPNETKTQIVEINRYLKKARTLFRLTH